MARRGRASRAGSGNEFAGLSRSARASGHGGAGGKGRGWKRGITDPKLKAAIGEVVRKAINRLTRNVRQLAKEEATKAANQVRAELKREAVASGNKQGFTTLNGLVGGGSQAGARAATGGVSGGFVARRTGRILGTAAIDAVAGAGGSAEAALVNGAVHATSHIAGRAAGGAIGGTLGGPIGVLVGALLGHVLAEVIPKVTELVGTLLAGNADKVRAELALDLQTRLEQALLEVDFDKLKARSLQFEQKALDKAEERLDQLEAQGRLSHRDGAFIEAGD